MPVAEEGREPDETQSDLRVGEMRNRRVECGDLAVERRARDAGEGVDVSGGELLGEDLEVIAPPLVTRRAGLLGRLRVEVGGGNGEAEGDVQRGFRHCRGGQVVTSQAS
jgi:hypothetical protein